MDGNSGVNVKEIRLEGKRVEGWTRAVNRRALLKKGEYRRNVLKCKGIVE
jgi:hypothetical protein